MTGVMPGGSIIELGVPGAEVRTGGGRNRWVRLRRPLLIAALGLCLFAPGASAPGRAVLGGPLWTGSVSLNGFTLGTESLYVARPDGKAVTALDLVTGRPRWSRDITGLPQSVDYVGHGVAVVMTRPPPSDGDRPPELTITLVRDATGDQIAQVTGETYLPSADGRLLMVFSQRFRDPDECAGPETMCTDVTAWDIGTGALAWKLNLDPNTGLILSNLDGRVDALAEIDTDGTLRLRDVSTGAVTGTMLLSPEEMDANGQVGLVQDMLLTARRGAEGITLTAYRRPSLGRSWSVVVPDFTPTNDRGEGILFLSACGPDVCMTVNGANTRVIDRSTGSVGPPITFDVIQRLGGGVFLAAPLHPSDGMGQPTFGFIVGPNGRTLAQLAIASLVNWSDSGDRALVTQEGPARTGIVAIDERGVMRFLGSVPGTRLTCSARADILACSDPGGALRVWRLPL